MTGVPWPVDSFVGRKWEVARLCDLLATSAVVTVFGPGGVGKSRLAVEVAARSGDRFPDGTVLVELSALAEPELLTLTVAAALGVREPAGGDLLGALAAELDGKRMLLLLDNCEHLAESCARLVEDLLGGCGGPRVLVTSREILRVPGEVTFRVEPLSLPAAGAASSGAELLRSDAVRLFVERAGTCDPGFELTGDNGPLVAEICTRLDGLPLAIELAAGRVRLLPLADIHDLLADRFELLSYGTRHSATRHRSLEAAIGWSHDLLDPSEQAVFRRLAVLAGGFNLAGATAVCATGDVPAAMVLNLLASLEAKSLVVPVPTSESRGRFRQLESVRLYAAERLAEAGELEDCQDRMAGWLTGLAESVLDLFFMRVRTIAMFADEIENLQQAATWAIRHDDDRQVLLTAVLAVCWLHSGHLSEGRRLLAAVFKDAQSASPPAHHAYALTVVARLSFDAGEYQEMALQAAAGLELGRASDHPVVTARALTQLGMAHDSLGEYTPALAYYRECADLVRTLGRPVETALCLNNLAQCLIDAGEVEAAEATLAEALPVFRAHADLYALIHTLHTAAVVALARGELDAAEEHFAEMLSVRSDGPWSLTVQALEGFAVIATRRGEPDRALRLAGAASAAWARNNIHAERNWERQVEEAVQASRTMLAEPDAATATEAGAAWDIEQAVAHALGGTHPDPPGGPVTDPAPSPLTDDEIEVARLVAEGNTIPEIAGELRVTSRTVYNRLERIRGKLNLDTRNEIAVWFTEQQNPAKRGQGPTPDG